MSLSPPPLRQPISSPIDFQWSAWFTSIYSKFITIHDASVSNVAELRLIDKTSSKFATTSGYYAEGDGGGSQYWYDSSDTTSADNGGSIIVSNDGGRWKLVINGAVNIRQFGAKGDGVTNDTVSIQVALTYAGTISGSLYFSKGTYMVAGNLTGAINTVLYGDGWNTIIKVINSSNPTNIIQFGSEATNTQLEIHDIAFDGNKSNNPSGGNGILITRGYKANLFNVRVAYCHGNGVVYSAIASSFENYIYGPSFYANDGYGLYMIGTISDTHIISGDIGYNGLGGVQLASSCSINGTTVWGGGQANSTGIIFAGVGSQVIGCKIEGHGKHGINVLANDAAFISGNKIYASSFTAANSGLYDGIYIAANADFGTITGNKIYAAYSGASPYSTRYAINFAGAHDQWTISGNDMALLVGGSPPAFKTSGEIVNGILTTDKCDFNWIRTNIQARLSADIAPTTAGAWTVFPYDVEDFDTIGEMVGGTFTPKSTGFYRIEASGVFTATAANEAIGLSLFTNAGVEIRRIDYIKSTGTTTEMSKGTIVEFLTGGTAYDIRYFTQAATTSWKAGNIFTYLKIKAVAS